MNSKVILPHIFASHSIPETVSEALSHLGWQRTMVDEMTPLHSNKDYELVLLANPQLVANRKSTRRKTFLDEALRIG